MVELQSSETEWKERDRRTRRQKERERERTHVPGWRSAAVTGGGATDGSTGIR